ncbi:hypothetical protein ABW21_db0206836 [Orbilia brochopaga]|nr:hypothetical protein ABW21_db0206836 [Drechslerella brochopaga]
MNNLRYANFNATDMDIYKACKAAAIHEQIEDFPDGYDTIVGERGVKLSGGQLQRIAIARAIIKNPKIILLDEATSMVDMYTERRIQSAFSELKRERTTFVIAHRLSTIINADQIVVVEEGKIVEVGTHGELLKKEKAYHSLWNKQVRQNGLAEDANKASNVKTLLVNDLIPPTQIEKTKGAKFPALPTAQDLKKVMNNPTTICKVPSIRQSGSATSGPFFPRVNDNTRVIRPASLPPQNNTMPNIWRQFSTLKPDAPEYVPPAPSSVRPSLAPFYHATTRHGNLRSGNASSTHTSTIKPLSLQAASYFVKSRKELPKLTNGETKQNHVARQNQGLGIKSDQEHQRSNVLGSSGNTINSRMNKTGIQNGTPDKESTTASEMARKESDAGIATHRQAGMDPVRSAISEDSEESETPRAVPFGRIPIQDFEVENNAEDVDEGDPTDVTAEMAQSGGIL